jgi:hypothetical protein
MSQQERDELNDLIERVIGGVCDVIGNESAFAFIHAQVTDEST